MLDAVGQITNAGDSDIRPEAFSVQAHQVIRYLSWKNDCIQLWSSGKSYVNVAYGLASSMGL
jgi:hypothetical protein